MNPFVNRTGSETIYGQTIGLPYYFSYDFVTSFLFIYWSLIIHAVCDCIVRNLALTEI